MFFKFTASPEPELRAAACKTIPFVCKSLSEEEIKTKLAATLKKLANDQTDYIKSIFYSIQSNFQKI